MTLQALNAMDQSMVPHFLRSATPGVDEQKPE